MNKKSLSVSLIVERLNSKHPWSKYQFNMIGVLMGKHDKINNHETLVNMDLGRAFEPTAIQKIFDLSLTLYEDECVNYRQNLISENPKLWVINQYCKDVESEFGLNIMAITADYDHAHAHLETEDRVDTVKLPPQIYKLIEDFVIRYYKNEEFKKRKRKKWV